MIKVLATTLSGSEAITIGRVQDKVGVPYVDEDEARAHLTRIGFANLRFMINEETVIVDDIEYLRHQWDNQAITLFNTQTREMRYESGAPSSDGSKISKSAINQSSKPQ